MKPFIKKTISYGILTILLVLFVKYLLNHLDDFKQIALINPLWLIPLIAIFLLNYFFISIQTKVLIEPFGIKLKNFEVYMLSLVTGFYNVITPAHGGMGVRAVYLKKKHNFTYTNFLASLAGMYVLTFFIGSLFGLISLFFIWEIYHIFNFIVFLVFSALFFPLLGIIIFSPEIKETKNQFINKFIKVANGWNLIRKNKKIVLTCLSVTFASLIVNLFSTILYYKIFGININFIQSLFLNSFGTISLLIQITPGNLGVSEALAVFSASILGISPTDSLSVAILGRIVQMIVLFILGPIFSYRLLKHKPK